MKPQHSQPTEADRAWAEQAKAKMEADVNYVVSPEFLAESHEIITRLGWGGLNTLADEIKEQRHD